jgi:hypothetical protein
MTHTISTPEYRRQILKENAADVGEPNVQAYAEQLSDLDPGFYRWLFGSEWSDFELPEEAVQAYQGFLQSLPTQ